MIEKPITKAMKARMKAEQLARLEAERKKRQEERAAALAEAQVKWEELIKALPEELDKLEQTLFERIAKWEEEASIPFSWAEISDPVCSERWELRYNEYQKWEEKVYYHYESSDGMRFGMDYELVVRECMPGTYWTSPDDELNREWFVSRAESPDGPIPPVQYPYCTISGRYNYANHLDHPNDKARVDAKVRDALEKRAYSKKCVEEALSALAGTPQERAKYLLASIVLPEGSAIRLPLYQSWRLLNPTASPDMFWEVVLGSL